LPFSLEHERTMMNLLNSADQAPLCAQVIHAASGHSAVPLRRLPQARLLWVNLEDAKDDPAFAQAGGDLARYEQHLMQACAFTIAEAGQTIDAMGVADRYGGHNIGNNGGSGRAAQIGNYHVKGVGRTPLVGFGMDEAHASGRAYLEECVRESILAEICARDFPHGSVRTLAIIDTGRVQVWQTEAGPKPEHCCLLVRRAFFRPAHIERATLYKSGNPREGSVDAERVRGTVAQLTQALGGLEVLQRDLLTFVERWAQQLAGSYVQCLPHGGVSSSNVCIDGRLVDFGAMAALPSLKRYWVASGDNPSGEEYKDILSTINSITCAFRFTVGQGEPARAWRETAIKRVFEAYGQELHQQVLRLLGFGAQERALLVQSPAYPQVRRLLDGQLARWRREVEVIFNGTPWATESMPSEAELQGLAERVIALTALVHDWQANAAQRQAQRKLWTTPRQRLGRENLKVECYDRLDGAGAAVLDQPGVVGALIDELVAAHSRGRD
jgi:uncharacterized protein YdiU (UPF0061 family)